MAVSKSQKMHYKEVTPQETLEKISKILYEMGLKVNEEWFGIGEIGTPSLRVTFADTKLGQNGKGINEEFARTSAYAELIERYAAGIIGTGAMNVDSKYKFALDYDEKRLTAEEIISQNDPYINYYYSIRDMENATDEEKAEHFKSINTIDYMVTGKKNSYLCLPFYDLKKQKNVYLPYNLILFNYGSNGMSAGNSPAEAIVQGLSEIYERYVQYRILTENIKLPNVPDSYIKKFPYIYEMYKSLQDVEGYTAIMKDCSLGGKYPVAGLLLIENNTGRYGFKLGCHPDFGVAMERTFTEAAQGRNILEYSSMSTVDFFNNNVNSDFNIENSYSVGKAQYPFEIFSNNSSDGFVPVADVSTFNNEDILANWLREIEKEGQDILIRDYSFLGFNVYHIIMPGLSETVRFDDSRTRIYNTRTYLIRALQNPEKMDKQDLEYIVTILIQSSKYVIMNEVNNLFPKADFKIPYQEFSIASGIYLAAQCSLQADNFQKAIEFMAQAKDLITKVVDEDIPEQKELSNRIRAEYYYLTALIRLHDHKKAIEHLKVLFDKKYCDFVDCLYQNRKNLISKQYTSNSSNAIKNMYIEKTYDVIEKRKEKQVQVGIDNSVVGRYLVLLKEKNI